MIWCEKQQIPCGHCNGVGVMGETFRDGRVTLLAGDCIDVIKALPSGHFDSVVTDPPYHLTSIVKRFGKPGSAPAQANGPTGVYGRSSRGFMGKEWDGGDIAFRPELWAEVLRVLKPGGHVAAFSGTRTYHRMATAIEDAGFEIRDQLQWLYGSGFPKSHDVSKAIDKVAGHWRCRAGAVVIEDQPAKGKEYERTEKGDPITPDAARWHGYGTALKPANEPICLARKPLDGTVAANVLAHGCGALNIDGCRVETGGVRHMPGDKGRDKSQSIGAFAGVEPRETEEGRWPANVVHDGSPEVVAGFPAEQHRFFYSAKASKKERAGSKHPTVKPVALMRWLVRLVTPPGGLVLDPFVGTGTTGEAAVREGFQAVLIEREAEYRADIARRIAGIAGGTASNAAESASPVGTPDMFGSI